MDPVVLAVFSLVYIGMVVGRYPGLALDRTGIALLGAIVLLAAERVSPSEAWNAIDVSTIALLFGLMIVSAQFRLGGFYSSVTRRLAEMDVSPTALLAAVIAVAGLLASVLTNDVVCLAMAPLLIDGCGKRGLHPLPFLLGLACATNVGSAATLIGNPQNILIGQSLDLSFSGYLIEAAVPSAFGLVLTWGVIHWQAKGKWFTQTSGASVEGQPFDAWQTCKGAAVTMVLIALFLFTDVPREIVALGGAGILLLSRRMHSRTVMELVDWHLIVLFTGLFVVNHAVESSGLLLHFRSALASIHIDLDKPAPLFGATVVLSNLVSNVPATMLLLPSATHPMAGSILALASTLAGNLFIVGSIANIIVVDQANRYGLRIGWMDHAKVGVPVTLLTLASAAAWLWLVSAIKT